MRKGYRKPYGTRPLPARPTGSARMTGDAELDPATRLRSFAIGLFDRREGHAADWPLIAETLFRAAFAALDEVQADKRSLSVLRRVLAGSYDRIAGNTPDEMPVRSPVAPCARPDGPEPSGFSPCG